MKISMRSPIIVLDDDPTGSQTVHSCLLLLKWDIETLKLALVDSVPIIFILSNTRALSETEAILITRQICCNLKIALAQVQINNYLIVSRSDSTLRGHYPVETIAIKEELGDFDANFLVPAFFEGGRVTINSVHYVIDNGVKVPVSTTEFARDPIFSYNHSYLPAYIAEKNRGKIAVEDVKKIQLEDIRSSKLLPILNNLKNNCYVVVDGETQQDLDIFARAILKSTKEGKRFLFRSAASLLTSLAQLGKQPVPSESMAQYKPTKYPGVIFVGSYVNKTTEQLNRLLREDLVTGIEIDLDRLWRVPESVDRIFNETISNLIEEWQQGKTPVIFTSRKPLEFPEEERLMFSLVINSLFTKIFRHLPAEISFIISKGGITSQNILTKALNLTKIRLYGQIAPGCSLVITPSDISLFPNLPIVLFPGNVGESETLVNIWQTLKKL